MNSYENALLIAAALEGVELHRMSMISLGETKPTSPNDTAQAQSENRRVVIITTGP
jgi:flagellar motor protein MotB